PPMLQRSIGNSEEIANLKGTLASEFATMQTQRDFGKTRLFVDCVFMLRGIGTVVTGALSGGSIRRGQDVVVQPRNTSARVRSIQNHGRDIEMAHPGMRTAKNLPDVAIGEDGIQRGDLITTEDL